ncbi:PepSY domain-containing protein [Anoxybacteroides tepidamans]|uniref:PepSY domain-containing protein n=1 Tax=Anoxybacteroides tepidamans TaxID=265948 RepID=UPI000486AD84|nr:PepSY domain-containing protein [Anoxybacillus tepidamans]
MSWRKFIAGAFVGFAVAYAIQSTRNNKIISSEKALSLAKDAFQRLAPISGSWIQTNPEPYEKNNIAYKVYKGGICRGEEQYEFVMDAHTGTIIETKKL